MNTANIVGVFGKSMLIFGIGYLFIRLMKKHSMGATTPFDFLITVLLGTILAEPLVSERMDTILSSLGKDQAWLMNLLGTYGIGQESIAKISLATLDGLGKLHVDYFENKIKLNS